MTLASRALAIAAASFALLSDARAQSAGAEALFREGRALIKQGKLEAGCDKLAASEKLESSVGTLLNLGDCREKLGKTASAWAAFRKAEAMAKRAGDDKKRQAEARRRALRLERQLSNIVIQIGPTTARTPGLVIKRNGELIAAGAYNTPIPVDPGLQTVVVEAPGYETIETEVAIGKGGKRYVVIPSLEPLPTPPRAAAPIASAPATTTIDTTPDVVVTRGTWSATRAVAVGVAVLGAGAIGGGIYFGTRADDLQSQSDAICPTLACSDPEGLRLNDDAQDHALRANLLFIAGGAAVATAAVMWFVGRPDETTVIAPTVGDGRLGAAFVGRF